jgi:ketosteroid isomerase-like protein
MDKAAFASAARSPSDERPIFDGVSDIKEIHVEGNIAYMWSHLMVTVTLPRAGGTLKRAGHTLTVLRKIDGRWLLARDANLLVKL